MIVLDGQKFACQKCIRGHRTSSCQHSDQPLIEVKPKGRPQTLCDHCRQVRKIKQVHVNCSCATQGFCCCRDSSQLCQCISPRRRKPRVDPAAPPAAIAGAMHSSDTSPPLVIGSTDADPVAMFDAELAALPSEDSRAPSVVAEPWTSAPDLSYFSQFCACGPSCQCAGCQNQGTQVPGNTAPVLCGPPYSCPGCLDCTILGGLETMVWQP